MWKENKTCEIKNKMCGKKNKICGKKVDINSGQLAGKGGYK